MWVILADTLRINRSRTGATRVRRAWQYYVLTRPLWRLIDLVQGMTWHML
jgi:hypothetical protein